MLPSLQVSKVSYRNLILHSFRRGGHTVAQQVWKGDGRNRGPVIVNSTAVLNIIATFDARKKCLSFLEFDLGSY